MTGGALTAAPAGHAAAQAAPLVPRTAGVAAAQAAGPYERGPAPTDALLEALRGPFTTSEQAVSPLSVRGFGGGRVYYPDDTSQGTFGAVAISPGYTASWASISWLGPRIASHGFVVIGIDTLTRTDQPASRGRQLLAALDYLVQDSPAAVRSRIDASRLAVAGHSMGGGGSLEAAEDRPQLQAAIPLAPWNLTKNWSGVRVPTLIIGAEYDTVAPVATHSQLFYESIPASSEKAYLELNGAGHLFPATVDTTTGKYMVAWLKRFVDDDTRYEPFLCPAPRGGAIEEYRDTCPHT
ncbi:alpha/beta hydrolase family protein [Nonomuraea rhodomycinica]|uniref:poly(ethylene terephthalate) hydrolase n=1 Tax=Nonomuraea rhodomycinica TaxID=1712872 RepID=A0A7Y6MET4_9ACTN|nr:alpha/beta hydrolase [Nonomuraea rhodomycinica]